MCLEKGEIFLGEPLYAHRARVRITLQGAPERGVSHLPKEAGDRILTVDTPYSLGK